MKTNLPKRSKIHEENINNIAKIIIDNFQDHISYLILFGSFARGNWVFDSYTEHHARFEYASDFDFLIITRTNKQGINHAASKLEDKIENKLEKYVNAMRHKPHFVIEAPSVVNEALRYGGYFYSDIVREGICLYDSKEIQLEEAKELTPKEVKEMSIKYYDKWYSGGLSFFKHCKYAMNDHEYNNAAFMLHQATECLLNCTLLVLTGYTPKTHDIKELLKLCSSQRNEFLKIFPKGNKQHEKCFTLLRNAYLDARYKIDYKITEEQLEYLIKRIKYLKEITDKTCQDWINGL